jgi:hypothetical protein
LTQNLFLITDPGYAASLRTALRFIWPDAAPRPLLSAAEQCSKAGPELCSMVSIEHFFMLSD